MWTRVLLLALVLCGTHSRNIGFQNGGARDNRVIKTSQCFGLARRTRTVTIDVPVLYNSQTGHTSPIPRFLLDVDDGTITKMEQDGWEVRQRRVCVPQHFYERVPVCCPWDQACQRQTEMYSANAAAPGVSGPCANGGQLIYQNGLRRCECPRGFKGLWCQISEQTSPSRTSAATPSGPLLRSRPVSPYQSMMTQADLWRRQQHAMQESGRRPMVGHLLRAMAGPWGQQVAQWQKHMMMQLLAQWCQQNGLNRVPHEFMRALHVLQASGGNPYSMQGRLPPQLIQALMSFNANPYSVATNSPHQIDALANKLAGHPALNMAGPFVQPTSPQDNPYNMVRPYGDSPRDTPAMPGPAARTPWDLDPFPQQPPQVTSARPRVQNEQERLRAMALYQQYLASQNRGRWGNDVNRQMSPVTGMELSRSFQPPTGRIAPPQAHRPPPMRPSPPGQGMNPYNSMPGAQTPQRPDLLKDAQMPDMPEMPQMPDMPNDVQIPEDNEQPTEPQVPQMPAMPNAAQMPNDMPMPPMPNGAPMPGAPMPGAPMPGAPGGMSRPSPEEIAKIETCRKDLEPRMDVCLSVHQITMPQFMDPEYMATAKSVCQSSNSVGQCLMQLDKVCGESEDQVMLTRKMINSVLQMMGMICQQIQARGDTAMPPPPEMPRPEAVDPPTLVEEEEPLSESRPPTEEREDPANMVPRDELPAFVPPSPTEDKPAKFDQKAPAPAAENEITAKAASQKATEHHGVAEPVQAGPRLWGYPLWMVISLLALIVALTLLTVLLACLCVRRKRRQQKTVELQKEIEKMPEPLDGAKLAAIGIPPPVYTTTAVQQTHEDGLSLPPLDIPGEEEEEEEMEKPPKGVEEDADDESDEKEDGEKKEKKKEKKDRK